jgi:hypothetical protein
MLDAGGSGGSPSWPDANHNINSAPMAQAVRYVARISGTLFISRKNTRAKGWVE